MEETNEDENEDTTAIVVDLETTHINNEDVVVGACIKLLQSRFNATLELEG
jgi:hypothetical protein